MLEKLKSIFIFNGFEPKVIRTIRSGLVDVTAEALSKLSLGLAMMYVVAVIIERNTAFIYVDILYMTAIVLFQLCLYFYRKTKMIHIAETSITLFIIAVLSISLYESTYLCTNSVGTFFPVYLLLFAVMFTGNPIAIDVMMLGMTIGFFFASHAVKSYDYFRQDFFTTGFVLLIANMVNAMVARARISAIVKTAEVEESQKKYAAMAESYLTLYNNVPCGIFELKDIQGKQQVMNINSRGLSLYGYSKEDDITKRTDVVNMVHADDKDILKDAFAKLTKVGDKAGCEYRLKRKDGTYTWVIGQALVTACHQDEKIILAACVDIDAEKKAIDANEAKSKFLSRMSHDIRTPMNAIIGLTDITLDTKELTEETRANLESVKSASMFLLGLINDILDVSKIEANEMELHKEPYYIGEFLNYLDTMIKPLCEKKGIDFIVDNVHDEYKYLLTDKVRFNQIFFNLLSNAVKFTPTGGRVEVIIRHGEMHDKFIPEWITISDTGIGMSEEFQQHMFEPFSQENGEHVNESQGSGLGLAIVKQIVDLMGGTIQVDSKKGKGTKYDIRLDMEICDAVEETKKEVDTSLLRGKRVLLCEDQPVNRKIAQRLLEKADVLVDLAEDGSVGLEKFIASAKGYYNGILMDIRMPVMNGIEATKEIRASTHPDAKTIPIIAMTANAFDTDKDLSMAAGMNDHIIKPVDPNTLYRILGQNIL